MTADIELLPLPEWMSAFIVPDGGKEVGCDHRLSALMKHYARANMEPLIAEIEALRAEVDEANADFKEMERLARKHKARAERLAEALRELKDLMLGQVKWEPCDCGCPQQRTPDGPHSVTWLRAAQQVEIAISKAEGKE